jgi:serine/threonine protein kinase/tetratricopeptide (TPR) repeat protein
MSSPDTNADDGDLIDLLVDYHAGLLTASGGEAGLDRMIEPGWQSPLEQAKACLRLLEELRGTRERGTNQSNGTIDDEAPLRFGRFEIWEELGRGGHGIVYRAYDPLLKRDVALKIPRSDTLASDELRERFLQEAQAVATLPHPHLVPVYEVGQVGPACYIASQYCPGPTLAAWLKRQTAPIEPRVAAEIVHVIASTVAYVHRHGILHRDLKPANVLIDREPTPAGESPHAPDSPAGSLKLTDFGLAKLLCGTSGQFISPRPVPVRDRERGYDTRSGMLIGTPAYMAAEQASGRLSEIGPQTDIYAIGVMLYELLTGAPPFQGRTEVETLRQVNEGVFPAPRRARPAVPRDLEAVCLKCLERRPQDRYATAADLAEDLARFLDHRPVTARPIGWLSRLERRARRRPAVWGLAAALLVTLTMAAGIAGWNSYRLEQQRVATDNAFGTAFQRWHRFYRMALNGVETAARTLPLSDSRRSEIGKGFASFLDRYTDEVPIRHDVVYGYNCLATLHRVLGEQKEFNEYATKTEAAGRRLIREADRFPALRQHLAGTYFRLALLDAQRGNTTQALAGYRHAAQAASQTLKSGHTTDERIERDVHKTLAYSHRSIGEMHRSTDPAAALQECELSCRVLRTVMKKWPEDRSTYRQLAECLIFMGRCLTELERGDEALAVLDEARRLCEISKPGNVHDWCKVQLHHADACFEIALIYGDADRAQPWFQRAVESLEQLLAEKPFAGRYRRRLAYVQTKLGHFHFRNGRWADARAAYSGAVDNHQRLLANDPSNERDRLTLEKNRRYVAKSTERAAL